MKRYRNNVTLVDALQYMQTGADYAVEAFFSGDSETGDTQATTMHGPSL